MPGRAACHPRGGGSGGSRYKISATERYLQRRRWQILRRSALTCLILRVRYLLASHMEVAG
jgi:hypothetical protein